MKGKIRITIRRGDGTVSHDCTISNTVQAVVINALAAKIRDNTLFPDEYVPNFMSITNNLMQTVYPRIQSRAALANGGMYFYASSQFDDGEANMAIYSVGLLNDVYWPIAGASGSEIESVLFNPSDTVELAYTIKISASEDSSSLRSSYFKEVAAVMLGVRNIVDYEADNSRYVVPNQAKLLSETTNLIDSKWFSPKGTGSFIGTSEGDLEWKRVMADVIPYYVQWVSNYSERPDLVLGTTDLDQDLRDAYPDNTKIETRFSMELNS